MIEDRQKAKLYVNGDIITMKSEGDIAGTLVEKNGRIALTGKLSDTLSYLKSHNMKYEKIDLAGKTVLPAFIDTHSHISTVARFSTFADLTECESFEDIISTMMQHIEKLPDNEPAIGFGYDHNNLQEKGHPEEPLPSLISQTRPTLLIHISGHMGCANNSTFSHCGMEHPDKGYVEEKNLEKIRDSLMKSKPVDMEEMLAETQKRYSSYGITTAQDGGAGYNEVRLLSKAASGGKLQMDVVGYIRVDRDLKSIYSQFRQYTSGYNARYRIGGHKLLLDGSPQGKTAWLTKPYEDGLWCGEPWYTDEEVSDYIRDAINKRRQILVHCNGDAAADQLLSIYMGIVKEKPDIAKADLRPVMLHCQTVRDDQLDLMKRLGMIPSMFVDHTYYWGDVHMKNLGDFRGTRISPAASALDKGLKLTLHQDSPTVKPDMLHTVWAAVNRISRSGKTIGENQRISVYEALEAVTKNAAYQYHEEDQKGTIEAGKLADLVILDKNPLVVEENQIKNIKVKKTIKEGKTIFET